VKLVIRNAEIFQPDGGRLSCDLSIQEGRIRGVSRAGTLADGEPGFDATGLIVTPGWIDIQLNGGFGHDFTEEPSSIWEVAARLPSLGLTAFLPTIITCPLEKLERAIRIFRKGPPPGWEGATPLGLHLEGPFLNPAKKGAHNPAHLRTPDPEIVRQWTRSGGIWLVTLAPELPGAGGVIGALRKNGVLVSAGHTLATCEQAQGAFAAGVTCGTHLFNAQAPLGHREPGFGGAVLATPEIFTGLIADGVHVHPAMVNVAWQCKRERLILVTDAVSALGMPPGKYGLGDFEVTVDETSVRLADGTLAGSNANPERCVRNLAAWTGCGLDAAAGAMSRAPAKLLGISAGREIISGADADLTLITPEGRVAATIVGGKLLYTSNVRSRMPGVRA
jgi:N-acetylglucosamine-6-phosphate deacetylase